MFSKRYEHSLKVTVYEIDGTAYFSVDEDGDVRCDRVELGYGKDAIELYLPQCAVVEPDGVMRSLADVMEAEAERYGIEWRDGDAWTDRGEMRSTKHDF